MNFLATRTAAFMKPPSFDDSNQMQRARLLNIVIWLAVPGLAVITIGSALVSPQPAIPIYIYIALLGLLYILRLLLHRGLITVSSIGFVSAGWIITLGATLAYGGTASPVYPTTYMVWIVLAGLLLGPRGVLLTAVVNAITVFIVYRLTETGQIPVPTQEPSPLTSIITDIALFAVMAFFLYFTVKILDDTYNRASRNETVLRATLDQLQKTSVSKDYVDNILDSMSNLLIVLDQDAIIRTVNPATLLSLGYDEDELLGKSFNYALVYDKSVDITETLLTRIPNIRNVDQRLRKKDGSFIYALISSSLMEAADGTTQYVVIVAQDVTDRRKAELQLEQQTEQLALLTQVDKEVSSTLELEDVLELALRGAASISRADDGFILLTEDNGTHFLHTFGAYKDVVSTETFRLYGVVERASRTRTAELIPDVTQDPDYVADQSHTRAQMVIPLRSKDRVLGILNLETADPEQFSPERFEFLKLLAARIAGAVDNARLYQLGQEQLAELKSLYAQITELEHLKTDMIRIASHDLRGPIGLINGYLQLLRLDIFDKINAEEQDYIKSIETAMTRMDNIVRDILSLERIHQMAQELFTDTLNLQHLAERAVNNYREDAAAKHIALTMQCDPAITDWDVGGDEPQLYEVLTNLIWNAIKYTPENGAVNVVLDSNYEGRVRFRVIDTGYGIPLEQQERLFQPFFRAKSPETLHIEGTGLGLHLVKNIVERHGGRMVFESEYQKGSTFGFELPCFNADPSPES